MPQRDDYEFLHINTAATTIVVGAACKLININVNTIGGTVTVYNAATSATCTTTNVVGVIVSSAAVGTYLAGGKKLGSGLVILTGAAAGDITVTYATA